MAGAFPGGRRRGGESHGRRLDRGRNLAILLAGIVIVVLAQLGWWLYFHNSYVARMTRDITERQLRDAELADALLAGGATRDFVSTAFPEVLVTPDGHAMTDPAARTAFLEAQERRARVFILETAGFMLVMVLAFWLMGRRLSVEQELKLQQQNFLSAVSHELKTPLSGLRLLVETALLRPLSPERQVEYLRRMEGEITRLQQLSETVLASTRLEEQREVTELVATDLGAELRLFLEERRAGFEARGAEFSVDIPAGALPVALDRSAFTLILANLVDNAIKYSPGGHKPVLLQVEDGGHLLRLHVGDRGIGIPAGSSERIYDRFYRVGSELVRTAPGVGLGLHLVSAAAEAMNGWVSDQPQPDGPGTRFTLTLPRRTGEVEET